MANLRLNLVVVTTIMVAYTLLSPVASIKSKYVVGAQGWIVPPNPDYYEEWKRGKKFVVRDEFWFKFEDGQHTIREVENKVAYDTCNATGSGVVSDEHTMGITMLSPGVFYYICKLRCEKGQKVIIEINEKV
ncbi:early nodulin-like protein 5 [Bidens hawaiensis]|uniref:early nodulin-like protein 5 n=1 Tax=Bidens hawaiensis TaxID=980011 RepID=UPI00404ACDCF